MRAIKQKPGHSQATSERCIARLMGVISGQHHFQNREETRRAVEHDFQPTIFLKLKTKSSPALKNSFKQGKQHSAF